MSTSDDRATPTVPKAPELSGVDVSRAASAPGLPSVEQLAAWANEMFKSSGASEPALPPTPGTSSGFAIPDPAAHGGRRAPNQPPISPPTLPGFASIAAPSPLASDPMLGPQLNLRPDFVSQSIVANPTLGGVDPIGRGNQIPSPQALSRQTLARLSPSAAPSVPFYFLQQDSGAGAPAPTNIDWARVQGDPLQPMAAKGFSAAPDSIGYGSPGVPGVAAPTRFGAPASSGGYGGALPSGGGIPGGSDYARATSAGSPRYASSAIPTASSYGTTAPNAHESQSAHAPGAAESLSLADLHYPAGLALPRTLGLPTQPSAGYADANGYPSANVLQGATGYPSTTAPGPLPGSSDARHQADQAGRVPITGAERAAPPTSPAAPGATNDVSANNDWYRATSPAGFAAPQPSAAAPSYDLERMRGYDALTTPANVVDLTPSYARNHDRARGRDFTPTHAREQRASRTVTGKGHHYDPRGRDPERPGQFDVNAVRADFPILGEQVQGKQLVWLDNAATTQKPQVVIDRLAYFYAHENSNIHRGAHSLAARSTDAYENARESVRRFLNAGSTEEIVFVRGTTEGINLIANAWGSRYVEAGDEIIVTRIEHHSNIVPWQMLCQRTGAKLRVAEVDDTGQVRLDQYERLFNQHTRLVSFTHVSNALGTILPVAAMTQIAHRHGVRVVIDGAQSVCHMRVDVQQLDADFYVFSGHKVFGPTGIGAVYGKKALLQAMPPWQGGGNMIGDVTFDKTEYQPAPMRFEAGTGNIADAVGLGAALDYLEGLGMENVARHEHELLEYGTHKLLEVPGLHMVGTASEKAAVLGFVLENVASVEVGSALAANGIAVRAGHHCAQPALRRFGHETTVRPSLAVYNNRDDIDALVSTLHDLQSRWLR